MMTSSLCRAIASSLIGRVCILALSLCITATRGQASEAAQVYRDHFGDVKANSVTQLEGYLFSSASFIPRSQTSAAVNGALKRSHFQAKIQIVDKLLAKKIDFEDVGLDGSLEGQFISSLRQVFLQEIAFDLSGLEVVFEAQSQTEVNCVLAIPLGYLDDVLPSNQDARQLILASAFSGNYALDPIVVAELSRVDQFTEVVRYWSKLLELKYDCEGLSDAINFKPIPELPKGMGRTELLLEDGFKAMSLRQGLKYSSLFLNFPPYARAIAEKARLENCAVTETVFLYFGACFSVKLPDQIYCFESLEERGFSKLIPDFAGSFHFVGNAEKADSTASSNLDSILSSSGGFRLIDSNLESLAYQCGNDSFFLNPTDLRMAEVFYSKAVEETISSNVCNMLGRCYALNGSTAKAVALLNQAVAINSKHPYAGANLALALHLNDFNDEAIEQAQRALENPEISEWGEQELNNLLLNVQ